MDTYIAPVSTKFDTHGAWTLLTPVIGPVIISFLEPSQLPGEYTAHAAKCVAQRA